MKGGDIISEDIIREELANMVIIRHRLDAIEKHLAKREKRLREILERSKKE